jgi:hypothetical protein
MKLFEYSHGVVGSFSGVGRRKHWCNGGRRPEEIRLRAVAHPLYSAERVTRDRDEYTLRARAGQKLRLRYRDSRRTTPFFQDRQPGR